MESDLKATTKHVLLTLSMHLSPKGEGVFPSHRTLARECSRDMDTVKKHLRKVRGEWIDWRPRYTDKGRQTSNEYELLVPKGEGGVSSPPPLKHPPRGGEETPPSLHERDVKKGEQSSGLRPSPGEPGAGGTTEEPDPLDWYRATPTSEKPPTRHWNAGVTALWHPTDEQLQAQGGWPACSRYLKRLAEDYGASWNEVSAFIVGSRLLVDAGEVGGVEPGEPFFYGLPQDSESWDGATWWHRAQEAFRVWREERTDVDPEVAELLEGVAGG